MVPEGGCQCRGLSCRWMVQSSSSIVSAPTVAVAASVLWLWSSDSGRVSAVLFASLPLACSRSLSLSVSYSLTHLLFCLCHPALALSLLLAFFYFSLLPSSSLVFLSHFFLSYFTLHLSHAHFLLSLSQFTLSSPLFPFSRLGHKDRYPPSLSSSSSTTRPPLAELGRQLETSSAHAGLRSSHKHCSQDQRGRETSRA